MAKFSGKIGYSNTVENETKPGIWTEEIIEKYHRGDITKQFNRWQSGKTINTNINISNKVSIVADSFSLNNLHKMRYIHMSGGLWKITGVDIERPRLILSIGGVYNGPLPSST
jgi:hypothetical protein